MLSQRYTKFRILCYCLLLALFLGGCGPAEEEDAVVGYDLVGQVIAVDPERRTALIDHEEIPGFMPPMVMEFSISTGDARMLEEGMRIRGRMIEIEGGYALESIWPINPDDDSILKQAGSALRQDTVIRGRGAYREIGEGLPDFALYDQDAEVVQPARFRGKQIVLNFIFTRCPDPNMCPASTAKMMQVQAEARERGIDDLQLISITLDPEYDTPGVLNAYAAARGIDTSNFSFLTGPETAILDLMAQLGVLAFPEDGLIRHTLATILIDDEGKIIYREDNSGWRPEEFLKRMHGADPTKAPS